ncbi:MAG: DsbA family protein [Rhizobiaceae bacterium]|nr:DsbA family protein [Rhizobiaceae bacterium]
MLRTFISGSLAFAIAAAVLQPVTAFALTDAEKSDIETVVRDYLIRNPEVLLEALDSLEKKRAVEDQAAVKGAIASARDTLFASPVGTVLGNPEGDVTVVEFFDYNCGYCKRALADMEQLISADPKLRFVLKEIPVLGEDSAAATRVSLALRHVAPERYGEFHAKLLAHKGVANEDSALQVVEDMGVPEGAVRDAMTLPAVEAAIAEGAQLAGLLKINGTPSYVVADELVPGAIGGEGLAAKVANVRACASATC